MARNTRRARRGSTFVIVVLCFMAMLAFVALGVDYGAVSSARAELQIAADAAAMAAASALPDEDDARELATAYASRVSIRGDAISLSDSEVVVGKWDSTAGAFTPGVVADSDAVKITARYTLETPISSIFGFPSVDLVAEAGGGAPAQGRVPDLVIIQDVTTSFRSEIGYARQADQALVDCIEGKADPESKIALVAFSGLEKNLLSPSELVTYATSYATVTRKISSIAICGNSGMPDCLNTNIASGLFMADQLLDGSTSPEEVGRAALLVSDGAPTYNYAVCAKDRRGKYATDSAARFCPVWRDRPSTAKVKAAALTMRDEMEAKGYDVYTVFYNETSDPTQTAFMEALTAGDGLFLESPDPTDLGALLTQVCHAYTNSKPGLLW
jgi:Flp pilus assembly protein TadG